jgi:hypothetical protein
LWVQHSNRLASIKLDHDGTGVGSIPSPNSQTYGSCSMTLNVKSIVILLIGTATIVQATSQSSDPTKAFPDVAKQIASVLNDHTNPNSRDIEKLIAELDSEMIYSIGPLPTLQTDDRSAIYGDLDWAHGDSGYNEGALCGFNALQGIAGVELPEIPLEENALGNIWIRVDMMNAAILAYRLGYKDEAVKAATCSQVHNDDQHQLLSNHPNIVGDWLASQQELKRADL